MKRVEHPFRIPGAFGWLWPVLLFVSSAGNPAEGLPSVSQELDGGPGAAFVPGEVIVRIENAAPLDLLLAEQICGAISHRRLFEDDIWLLRLEPGADVRAAACVLAQSPLVEYAHPNMRFRVCGAPGDPDFSLQWGFDQASDADIDAPEAWDIHSDAGGIVVAVIDTGAQYDHPDLADNIWTNPGEIPGNGIDDDGNGYVDDVHGWDFVNDDADPMDDNGHGTHTSGTIGAVTDNGLGVAGVCWNVQIMPLKIANQYGGIGDLADAVSAVEYSMDNGARLSSNSWGGYLPYDDVRALEDAIHTAWETRGMVFVAAAGNANKNNDADPFYPASLSLPEVISVAASDSNDDRASFSNYGRLTVDLAAPGVDVYSTMLGGGYAYLSGTSMACPHVAGAVALMKAYLPERDFLSIKQKLMSSVDLLPSWQGLVASNGRLNLEAALVATPCGVTFRTGGQGLAGSGGYVPQLTGTDGPCGGVWSMRVGDGLGGATGFLWVGLRKKTVPAFGGSFYIDLSMPWFIVPIRLQGPVGVPGAGYLEIPGPDVTSEIGTALFMQTTLVDPGAPRGVSLSGWLKLTVD